MLQTNFITFTFTASLQQLPKQINSGKFRRYEVNVLGANTNLIRVNASSIMKIKFHDKYCQKSIK